MTHFEYITVALSIVLALSIARCLDALAAAFDPSRRYWVHFTWLMVKLSNPLVFWWSMWEFRESHDWTFLSFLGAMLVAGTLYLQVNTLVTTNPDAVSDWRSHYYAKHRLFFGANVFLLLQLFITAQLAMDESFLNPWAIFQMTMILLSTTAMVSKNPTVHGWVAVLGGLKMFVMSFGVTAGRSMTG
ncbi:MAG: hypothetical protein JRF61_02435 [Deltaproteobacteria bacterium]|nr:hypothetical protein [Deltaproteobacteria bacterium]